MTTSRSKNVQEAVKYQTVRRHMLRPKMDKRLFGRKGIIGESHDPNKQLTKTDVHFVRTAANELHDLVQSLAGSEKTWEEGPLSIRHTKRTELGREIDMLGLFVGEECVWITRISGYAKPELDMLRRIARCVYLATVVWKSATSGEENKQEEKKDDES